MYIMRKLQRLGKSLFRAVLLQAYSIEFWQGYCDL